MSVVSVEYPTSPDTAPDVVGAALGYIYGDFFGLKENPFAITPDPRYLYMSPRHRDALAHLVFAVKQGGGFVQLTGEVGTGKTTLTRAVLTQLPSNVTAAIILNPRQSALEFVQSICDELRVPETTGTGSIKALTDGLNAYLLYAHSQGRRTVILIDEAQNLGVEVLEQIRLLTNLETAKEKLLQIVLIGQPELRLLLDRRELRQLAQRITARYHLLPLSADETAEMVKYRLAVAGHMQPLFTDSALRLVHRVSQGVPRLINVICDRALLGAYAETCRVIDRRIVLRAASEVIGEMPERKAPKINILAAAGLGITVLGSLAALVYNLNSPAQAPTLPAAQVVAPPETSVAPGAATTAVPEPLRSEIAAAANPAAATTPVTFAEALNNAQLRADLDSAMEILSKRWSKDYRAAKGFTPCERAQSAGLTCYRGNSSLSQLRQLDHPVILKLVNSAGAERYAVLMEASSGAATLALEDATFNIAPGELRSFWHGDYLLLWHKPAIGTNSILPGAQGIAVTWLVHALDRIEGISNEDGNVIVYDDALSARVKAFQKRRGLIVDGIVGERTLIHIAGVANDPPSPRLVKPAP
ncbi:MAG: AAA family ATPase [Gammaproteobacteria bacterium]|nr:AAA family ATPase [Gammaproteobacteria bacterium]